MLTIAAAWIAFIVIGVLLLALAIGDTFDVIDTGAIFGSPLLLFVLLMPLVVLELILFDFLFS